MKAQVDRGRLNDIERITLYRIFCIVKVREVGE